MTLHKRLYRLEGKRGAGARRPSVIFLCAGESGEPMAALLMGGGSLPREDGETVEAFMARAMTGAKGAILLPDSGR